MRIRHDFGNVRRQQGMALLVSLIFLVILAFLGVASVQGNLLQERMAGNTRDRDLAFQAAEAALQDASDTFASWRSSAFDGTAPGLATFVATNANDAAFWSNETNWATYRTPAQTLARVNKQPQYRVEKKPDIGSTEYYRVTARGFGASAEAVVILQAEYSYTP